MENKISQDELGHEMISKYIELRKAKKLGPIWTTGQIIEFSDVDNILSRRVLPLGKYKKLISYWYPTVEKIGQKDFPERVGPKRETRINTAWNRRFY